jgi:hypothetical protein
MISDRLASFVLLVDAQPNLLFQPHIDTFVFQFLFLIWLLDHQLELYAGTR